MSFSLYTHQQQALIYVYSKNGLTNCFICVPKRLMSAHPFDVITSLCPGLWLDVVTTTTVPIGCETKQGNGKIKKILSTKVYVSFFLTFLVFSKLPLRIEKWFNLVAVEKAKWDASFRRNPKESHPKKRIVRRQQRLSKLRRQATRFPLATTPTRLRSSTAGIREKRWWIKPVTC